MSLLPSSRSESDSSQDGALRILDVDDDEADAVFDALSSKTTRTMLSELHRTPRTPAELAETTDTTVQNAMYHLEKLEDVGLARVTETEYSSRGKEMRVYAPSEHPAVVFIGTDDRKLSLIAKLKQFLGAVGVLGVLALAIDLLKTVEQSVGNHVVSPRTTVVAAATTFVTLVISSRSANGSAADHAITEINPMKRKTLLMTVVLLTGICAMPVAVAYSPTVSGEYPTMMGSVSTQVSPANSGVPDLANETVTIVVSGSSPTVRTAVSQQPERSFQDRGATVKRADQIQNVSGSLFTVQLTDSHIDVGGLSLTPSAGLNASFTYAESGNATVSEPALARYGGVSPSKLNGRVASGSFSFERGGSLIINSLNTIKRGGVNPAAFKQDVGTTVANTTMRRAFKASLWT
nr:helix-turn-helix domain-containing protein [Halobacterium salinarum]WJK64820.2 helix-turn-helix domain-containing protein [Halobacterium salinarum]